MSEICPCCHEPLGYEDGYFCVWCSELTIHEQISKKEHLRHELICDFESRKDGTIHTSMTEEEREKNLDSMTDYLEEIREEILDFTREIKELKEDKSVRMIYLYETNNDYDNKILERYKEPVEMVITEKDFNEG
ncbi:MULTISPECIES: hypothetical protein [unclassified Bacillus cereus group]|uniref:hypothetical protein n=1 Tax=unclassified Bacillus cereus group TaxID=2750818 RepID=UPI0029C26BAC|nr:hypothetical protein [Bacillus cereus group sp. BfR-BA-00415]MDX5942260.1 hypothetical protein [Bacillus cereus group sp. BfR-BA-00415]